MRRRIEIGILWVLAAGLVACGGSGDGGKRSETPDATGPSEAQASEARKLFVDEGCPMCHGEMGQGVEELGPALRELKPYWDRERLMSYIEDPESFRAAHPDFEDRRDESFNMEMPSYDYLSVEQRGLLADWLLTR
jgi:hypothetical protein